jgi:hypothetical protein
MRKISDLRAIFSLLIANLIPLFGVLFGGWNVFAILALYWWENVVIGVLNILKMKKAQGHLITNMSMTNNGKPVVGEQAQRTFLLSFFALHYGIFTFVHGVFIAIFFFSQHLPFVGVAVSALSLTLSHFMSYLTNFIGNKEYLRVSPDQLFWQPYKRIIVVHVVTIIGGVFAFGQSDPKPLMLLMVGLKIIVDLISHLAEHRNASSPASSQR